jgi:hypothetical protein
MRSRQNAERPARERPRSHETDLADAVDQCRRNGEFLAGLGEIYQRVDAGLAEHNPVCRADGTCCKFNLTAHRVYLSTGELALLSRTAPPSLGPCKIPRCPYQVNTLCTGRDRRPLGCRIFFCDPALSGFCRESYETHHRAIRLLHQKHCLPYAYVELASSVLQLFSQA